MTGGALGPLRRGDFGVVELRGFAAANVGALSVLLVFALVSIEQGIGFGTFSDDPSEAPVDRWYAGLLSDIGVGVWALAVPAALFAARITRQCPPDRVFFVVMAFASGWLAADDLFLLHEAVIPDATGIPEEVVFAVYAVLTLAVVPLATHTIRRHLGWVLVGAVVALGLSVVIAGLIGWLPIIGPIGSAFKFIGIVNWTLFFVDAAARTRRSTPLFRSTVGPSR